MGDFSGNVRTTASATNDVQSGCDAVGAVSTAELLQPLRAFNSMADELLQPLRVFNSIADEIANVTLFTSTMYVAHLRA